MTLFSTFIFDTINCTFGCALCSTEKISMLKTVIYASHLNPNYSKSFLEALLKNAQIHNSSLEVTGILIFDGQNFMQLLEGPSESVDAIYSMICKDIRHQQIIELLSDYGPRRYFPKKGMEFFDITDTNSDATFQKICELSSLEYKDVINKRVFKYIHKFISGKIYNPSLKSEEWVFQQEVPIVTTPHSQQQVFSSFPCAYTFQPILDPLKKHIYYLEALIRTNKGGSAFDYLSAVPADKTYIDDIHSKEFLFAIAAHVLTRREKVSINIMPESLVVNPNAPEQLLKYAAAHGITPERVVVEITENEIASNFGIFLEQINVLKSYGFMIALDDFGAGYAGLSMLTQIKPDKIKLDRIIICDIHKKLINQAVVKSVISFCNELGIELVAEGVESIEEWLWLKSVGIERIQGFLFSKGCINSRPNISWPTSVPLDLVNMA